MLLSLILIFLNENVHFCCSLAADFHCKGNIVRVNAAAGLQEYRIISILCIDIYLFTMAISSVKTFCCCLPSASLLALSGQKIISNRCAFLLCILVFILLGGLIVGVLFLYPRTIVLATTDTKYVLNYADKTKSYISQTYKITNNNWYSISTENYVFNMEADPRQGLGGSHTSFLTTGTPSTTSNSIAGNKISKYH